MRENERSRLAIDNPIEAVRSGAESDQRAELFPTPTPARMLLKAVGAVLPPAQKLGNALTAWHDKLRQENHELLLQTLEDEMLRLSGSVENLQSKIAEWQTQEGKRLDTLLVDAANHTQDVADSSRVERIAKILARAIVIGPATPVDKAEELMRVARVLSDQDVEVLRQIYDAQFKLIGPDVISDIDGINDAWRDSKPRIEGVLAGDMLDILLKLQGQALVRTVERRQTKLGPNEQPFALLNKGADFVRWALGRTDAMG